MHRMTHRGMSLGFGTWRNMMTRHYKWHGEQHRKKAIHMQQICVDNSRECALRGLQQVTARWQGGKLSRAWSTWSGRAFSMSRKLAHDAFVKAKMRSAVLHMLNKLMSQGWHCWAKWVVELQKAEREAARLKKLLQRCLSAWRLRLLKRGMVSWTGGIRTAQREAREAKTKERFIRQAVMRMVNTFQNMGFRTLRRFMVAERLAETKLQEQRHLLPKYSISQSQCLQTRSSRQSRR